MNKKASVLILVILGLFLSAGFGQQNVTADLVLQNGRVFTADDGRPWVEAVAVKNGKILAIGTAADMKGLIGPGTKVLDVQGKLVLPGLYDAHTHFSSGGRSLSTLSFRGVNSVQKVQDMVAAKIKELPAGAPVEGGQYDHSLFPGGNWPTKEDLDKYKLEKATRP